MGELQMAVLFWCYKEPEICRERLALLRRYDPELPVYVLYGGEPHDAPEFEKKLQGLHDDFWIFDTKAAASGISNAAHEPEGGKRWKWYHGDAIARVVSQVRRGSAMGHGFRHAMGHAGVRAAETDCSRLAQGRDLLFRAASDGGN
jgi:hypothetical protein